MLDISLDCKTHSCKVFSIYLPDKENLSSIYELHYPRNKDFFFFLKLEEIYCINPYFDLQLDHLKDIALKLQDPSNQSI